MEETHRNFPVKFDSVILLLGLEFIINLKHFIKIIRATFEKIFYVKYS